MLWRYRYLRGAQGAQYAHLARLPGDMMGALAVSIPEGGTLRLPRGVRGTLAVSIPEWGGGSVPWQYRYWKGGRRMSWVCLPGVVKGALAMSISEGRGKGTPS